MKKINTRNIFSIIFSIILLLFYFDFRSYTHEQTAFLRECVQQQNQLTETLSNSQKGLVETQLGLMESYGKLSESYKILCESNSNYIKSFNNLMDILHKINERAENIESMMNSQVNQH